MPRSALGTVVHNPMHHTHAHATSDCEPSDEVYIEERVACLIHAVDELRLRTAALEASVSSTVDTQSLLVDISGLNLNPG